MKQSNQSERWRCGFGLVEVMVAMAIGMIAILVIMQVMSAAGRQRAQTTASGNAETAGALAMQALQRQILNAGAGLVGSGDPVFSQCFVNGVAANNTQRLPNVGSGVIPLAPSTGNTNFPAGSFGPLTLWPANAPPAHLNLAAGAPAAAFDPNTDIVQIVSGGSDSFFGQGIAALNWASPLNYGHIHPGGGYTAGGTTVDTSWNPLSGFHAGDLVIAVQAGAPCVISQITSLWSQGYNVAGEQTAGAARPRSDIAVPVAAACDAPPAPTNVVAAQINHANGVGFRDFHTTPSCSAVPASVWNAANPTHGIPFTAAMLFSLGSPERFNMTAYGVRNGQLIACPPLYRDCTQVGQWEVFADGVVSLRAQYGFDANLDRAIAAGEWGVAAPPINPNGAPAILWSRLKSFRVALVARGAQIERDPIDGAACAPAWSGNPAASAACPGATGPSQINLFTAPDGVNWNRYRYRIFEGTFQLRNTFWN